MNTANTDTPETWRDLYPYEPHYAVMPSGHRMHYVDEGNGPPVVLLHGNPTWSFMYRDLIRELRGTFRVISPDHIGCGLSDKPQDYRYQLCDHISNLKYLLDEVLELRSTSLVVHDWGGAIGMGYAVSKPERVARIVLLNTASFLLGDCPWRIRVCRLPLFGSVALRRFNAFARGALSMAMPAGESLEGAIREGYLHPYDSYANRIATLRFVQDIPLSPRHPSWETVGGIQKNLHLLEDKPILICWGEQDFCFTLSFLKIWQQYFPAAAVRRFPEAGHYLLESACSEIAPLVAGFLSGTGS